MVLQKLIQLLFAHPQIGPKLINKLADSWPIRSAARFTAYIYLRGKSAIEDKVKEKGMNGSVDLKKLMQDDAQKFARTFKEELKKQWEEAKQKEIENQKRQDRRRR